MKKETIFVIGYSLEACALARGYANAGNHVVFVQTGHLGHPLDVVNDMISYEDTLKLQVLGCKTQFEKLPRSSFCFVPYENIKFVNTRNGLFTWPICKTSFEIAEEWEEVMDFLHDLESFTQKLETANNPVSIYKTHFPRWLFDCLLKYVGVNKWGGLKQSKMLKEGIVREIDLSQLDSTPSAFYRPAEGYKALCEDLLSGIEIISCSIKKVRHFMDTIHRNNSVVIADNRVDYIYQYIFGAFERVTWRSELVDENNCPELMDVADGTVLTPTMASWCSSNHFGQAKRVYSSPVDDIGNYDISILTPAQTNKKVMNEYINFVKLQKKKY